MSFQRRMQDVEFARWLRQLAVRAEKRGTAASVERLRELADTYHVKVCVDTCSHIDVMKAIGATVPSGTSYVDGDEIGDEPTRPSTPGVKSVRPGWWPW